MFERFWILLSDLFSNQIWKFCSLRLNSSNTEYELKKVLKTQYDQLLNYNDKITGNYEMQIASPFNN